MVNWFVASIPQCCSDFRFIFPSSCVIIIIQRTFFYEKMYDVTLTCTNRWIIYMNQKCLSYKCSKFVFGEYFHSVIGRNFYFLQIWHRNFMYEVLQSLQKIIIKWLVPFQSLRAWHVVRSWKNTATFPITLVRRKTFREHLSWTHFHTEYKKKILGGIVYHNAHI